MKENIRKVLEDVRNRLARPQSWTKEAAARDQHGLVVTPTSAQAHQWCLMGAVIAEAPSSLAVRNACYGCLKRILALSLGHSPSLQDWNDAPERTHEELLKLLDTALSRFVILQGIELGNRFFSDFNPGEDPTRLQDDSPAYRILGWANTIEEAQTFLGYR